MKTTVQKQSTQLGQFVAEQVLQRRTALKITQAELAGRAGLTVESIARVERVLRHRQSSNCNPTLETLESIAAALGCEVTDLLTGRAGKKASDPIAALARHAKPATRRRITLVIEALLRDERTAHN